MTLKLAALIALGGAAGTLARFWISALAEPWSQTLPWGTIAINVAGSLVIGAVAAMTVAPGRFTVSEETRLFVMVGLCGGFTTFSAFSLQTFELLRAGATVRAFGNVAISVVACVAAVAVGYWLASRLGGDPAAVPRP